VEQLEEDAEPFYMRLCLTILGTVLQ